MLIRENVLLKEYSTFKIGGPAKYFASVSTAEQAKEALCFAKEQNIPFHIIGKGSNTLFDDRGFNGLIIHNKLELFSLNHTHLKVGSGFNFSVLGSKISRSNLSGLEFASGIPGTVGGAICMNAGANGGETFDCLRTVTFLKETGEIVIFKKEELEFRYRYSTFQKLKGLILEATFEFTPSKTSSHKQKEILNKRIKTQPYKVPSCGCIFINPDGKSAGKIIDECGLKGLAHGGAEISPLHANFIVNSSNATSQDVLQLIEKIQCEIKRRMNIDLHTEIKWIPYDI